MNTIEEHEERLNQHDTELGEIKETVDKTDKTVVVIKNTTDAIAANVGVLDKEREMKEKHKVDDGYIQKGDWKGIIASIIAFALASGIVAVQLLLLLPGEYFWAAVFAAIMPSIYVLIKDLTGKDIKRNDLSHSLEMNRKEAAHKVYTDKLKGLQQMKMIESTNQRIRIARLEEQVKSGTAPVYEAPSAPILPPE